MSCLTSKGVRGERSQQASASEDSRGGEKTGWECTWKEAKENRKGTKRMCVCVVVSSCLPVRPKQTGCRKHITFAQFLCEKLHKVFSGIDFPFSVWANPEGKAAENPSSQMYKCGIKSGMKRRYRPSGFSLYSIKHISELMQPLLVYDVYAGKMGRTGFHRISFQTCTGSF